MKFVFIIILLTAAAIALNNHTGSKRIIMAYLVPWTGFWPEGVLMGSALIPALETVKDLLPGYDIEWHWKDTHCQSLPGMEAAIDTWKLYRHLDVIIGDTCSVICQPLALLASVWNIPMLSYGCYDMRLSNKEIYPTFSRVSGSSVLLLPMYFQLRREFGWARVGLVTGTAEVHRLVAEAMLATLRSDGVKTYFYVISPTNDQSQLKSTIRFMKREVRILFMFMYNEDSTNLILALRDEGMLNYGMALVFDQGFQIYTPEASLQEGTIILEQSVVPETYSWKQFASKVIQAFDDPAFQGMPRLSWNASINSVSVYAGLLHDAVLSWAYGVNKTLEQGYGPHDGAQVSQNILNSSFKGITGTITIDEHGDPRPNHTFLMIQNGEKIPLMEWISSEERMRKIYKPEDPDDWSGLIWPGNRTTIPSDSPPCGWHDELCNHGSPSHVDIIVLCVVSVAVTMVAIGIVKAFQKMRFEQELRDAKTLCIPRNDIRVISNLTSKSSLKSSTLTASSMNRVRIEIGKVRNITVVIKKLGTGAVNTSDRKVLLDMKAIKNESHENINKFVGVCLEQPHACFLMTYAPKGSLYDVLQDSNIKLNWDFKLSLATDVAQGMKYLHCTPVGCHGHLTSSNCVVNSKWCCQITDYGLAYIKQKMNVSNNEDQYPPWQLLWTAPELLNHVNGHPIHSQGTPKGDVYSFAIICQEVVLQDDPYADNFPFLPPEESVKRVSDRDDPPYRPYLSAECCSSAWRDMITQCWDENVDLRPTFSKILDIIRVMGGGKIPSLVDSMVSRLESHTRHLESVVTERSKELGEEKMKMEVILQDLLPISVAEKLKNGLAVPPETFDSVTILFSDIVSFTQISAAGTPIDVVKMLNFMYTVFDDIAAMFDVYKVATIGDAYFVASGVPTRNEDRHAVEICNMALKLMNVIQECPVPHMPEETLQMRIGIHSGPCVAGIAGIKMPRYLLFGETVDAASNLEATGVNMRIHISSATKRLIDKTKTFETEERGDMIIKGLGKTTTYWLNG